MQVLGIFVLISTLLNFTDGQYFSHLQNGISKYYINIFIPSKKTYKY